MERRHLPAARPSRVLALCGGMVVPFGLERITFEVLRATREAGGAVHVIVNGWESHRITALADAIGASWSKGAYRAPLNRRRMSCREWLRVAVDIVATSGGCLRDAWRFRPTVVLVPELSAVLRNWPSLLLLRMVGVPIVMRLGNAPSPGRFHGRLWRLVINPVIDRFVCNSRFTEVALQAHGIAAGKTSRIANAVPVRAFGAFPEAPRDPARIVYVGQVIPEKGLDLLLEAVGMLVERGHDVRLDVVGPVAGWAPPEVHVFRERVRSRAAQPDLFGRVQFLGTREDVPSLLAAAGVHCCPSRPELREGFGLVVLEAKAAGRPSVVTPTGALPELVEHRENGWICAAATPDALAEGLEYFVADSARGQRAGVAARASLDAFSRDRFAAAWHEALGASRSDRQARKPRLRFTSPVSPSPKQPPTL
jgi:glycosyltransferase involved in cell wall biosynthesis